MANSPVITQQKDKTQLSPTSKNTPKAKQNLEQVLLTQKQLDEIKKNLNKMIDSMAFNPSLFSRAARYWGELPLWQKIVAGIVLVVPVFVIGFVAQVAVLLAISIFTLVAYTSGSLLLDNHHSSNIHSTDNLKNGISGLADALGVIILTLDNLREQLSGEIEKFQKENKQLSENISNLSDEIAGLIEQREQLEATANALRSTQSQLEHTSETLKLSVEEQIRLQKETQAELDKVTLLSKKNQEELSQKITDLGTLNEKMSGQVDEGNKFITALQACLESFSDARLEDQKQKDAFKEKIKDFLNDREKSLLAITNHMGKTAIELAQVKTELEKTKDQLNRNNKRYEELLGQQSTQIQQLSQIMPTSSQLTEASNGLALKALGVFSFQGGQGINVPAPGESPQLN